MRKQFNLPESNKKVQQPSWMNKALESFLGSYFHNLAKGFTCRGRK